MSKEYRKSTLDAINNYIDRVSKSQVSRDRKMHYGKPEKEVEKACTAWMRARGWKVDIFEAKATWNQQADRWTQQSMKAGVCDCLGNTEYGIGVAVEFKAPKRLTTFNADKNYRQRDFIIDKINSFTFACVTDSVERLSEIYLNWSSLRSSSPEAAKQYLLSMLPKKSEKTRLKDEHLFDE